MNKIIHRIKEEQKAIAEDIKQFRLRRKPKNLELLGSYNIKNKIEKRISELSFTFRHRHIAYCELLGKNRKSIERPCEDNLPSESLINKYKDGWKIELDNDETLRISA